jgi:hypothetical protein
VGSAGQHLATVPGRMGRLAGACQVRHKLASWLDPVHCMRSGSDQPVYFARQQILANISLHPRIPFPRPQVYLSLRRLTGDTTINPAAAISLQAIAAWIKGDWLIFVRDVWPLVVPSVIAGLLGGYFMVKVYEPLLLYIKYRELAEEDEQEEDEEQERAANRNSTMI